MHRRLSLLTALPVALACNDLRAVIVEHYPVDYAVEAGGDHALGEVLLGVFDGGDAARPALPVGLVPVVTGLQEPTDIQFPPGRADVMVVLEKRGRARVYRAADGTVLSDLLDLDVLFRSEQGLLGLAFHPEFGPTGGRIFVNHVMARGKGEVSRVSAFTVTIAGDAWTAVDEQVALEVPQPYANHDAGQLAFGPDGMLYVGWGDGGWRDDPHNNGQDPTTFLGAMLRLDVDHPTADKPYGVPADNPFVARPGVPGEVWATGLRNPWRYSFDPKGRLVVADVGQNLWEEVDVVQAGDNLGWRVREARHCFPPDQACEDADTLGMVDPVWEYGRDDGQSITGGYVYTGAAIPALAGKFVVGDFVSGRMWALDLPDSVSNAAPVAPAHALGRFKMLISTFGRDAAGELYVADYQSGTVHKLVAPPG